MAALRRERDELREHLQRAERGLQDAAARAAAAQARAVEAEAAAAEHASRAGVAASDVDARNAALQEAHALLVRSPHHWKVFAQD